jgi:hypothetical protein
MNTGKIPRDNSVERSDYREFPLILLRKITKCKNLCCHILPLLNVKPMIKPPLSRR